MEQKAAAPGILKKSTSMNYTLEEKVINLEKQFKDYMDRINKVEETITELFVDDGIDTEEDDDPVGEGTFTISWQANDEPSMTQRDRDIAIWRMNNPKEPKIDFEVIDLTCLE